MLIAIMVLAVCIIVALALLISVMTGLKSISISADFTETELDVNKDYIVSVDTEPDIKLSKLDFIVDSSSATFEAYDGDDGKAILHTLSEGVVTICVKKDDIESNYLSFNVVDLSAREAAEAAAAEAEAEAERLAAEAAAAEELTVTEYAIVIGDKVRVRSLPSTDGDILGEAKTGDAFEVIRDDASSEGGEAKNSGSTDWTKLNYNGQDGYIRNDFLKIVSEDELESAKAELTGKSKTEEKSEEKKEEKKEEKPAEEEKKEEKKEETTEQKTEEQTENTSETTTAASTTAAVSDTLPALGSGMSWSYQGVIFTPKQCDHLHARFDYAGNAAELVTHHSAGELQEILSFDGY